MKTKTIWLIVFLVTAALGTGYLLKRRASRASVDRLLLLVPDGTNLNDPQVRMWADAGNEEGLHVVPMHDSDFLRPFRRSSNFSGVILPDSIHKQASDLLVSAIKKFVAEGGRLMLVYDAGTLSLNGGYAPGQSRFSEMVGVNYAMYESLRDETTKWSKVLGNQNVFDELGIPPGKYYPFSYAGKNYSALENNLGANGEVELRRYRYGDIMYPSFVTAASYSGHSLLHSEAGLVAGEHSFEKGSVLFVNLPLGYLKGNTDGLLLHGFLKFFAHHQLALPRLLSVPDGVGGLTLNWHVDSNAAIKPLQQMESWKILEQGPYSVHITAGPDANQIGDKRGFNAENNPISRDLIHEYERLGYSIGSHGGWIHDYFAAHVDTGNPKDLEQYLAMNNAALQQVTGKPVTEYSAPAGNQPQWVTDWLAGHGVVAYYFTGNTGMGPTEGYREGKREGNNIWAFPILHLDKGAAFEEFKNDNYPLPEIEAWLEAITTFAVNQRSVRLVYFHPPGILEYRPVVREWMKKTAALRSAGSFRWYTMTELANFLNSRKQVEWKVSNINGGVDVVASHPQSLEHLTWSFPADKYNEPKILEGTAVVSKNADDWLVIAGKTQTLKIEAKTSGAIQP